MILSLLFKKQIQILSLCDEEGKKFYEVQVYKFWKRDWYFLTYTETIEQAYEWLHTHIKHYNIVDIL